MNRRVYNFKILILLFKIFCQCKDLRFLQVLYNAHVIGTADEYNQESKETYERLKKYYKKVSNPEEKPKGDGNVKG